MESKSRKVGAGAPLALLVSKLARYGWGDLTGRDLAALRSVLFALGTVLDSQSATGTITVEQLATRAGVSKRWTTSRLQIMEELGILEWRRGGIDDGTQVPSWFRLDKIYLAGLVNIAQGKREAALSRLRFEFLQRLATLRKKTQWFRGPKNRNRRSAQVELSATLPLTGTAPPGAAAPYRVSGPSPGPPRPPVTPKSEVAARGAAYARGLLAAARQSTGIDGAPSGGAE